MIADDFVTGAHYEATTLGSDPGQPHQRFAA